MKGVRYTWIDGQYVQVSGCGNCPFYSTEFELGAECRYPCNPANNGKMFDWGMDGVRDDCPLKVVE